MPFQIPGVMQDACKETISDMWTRCHSWTHKVNSPSRNELTRACALFCRCAGTELVEMFIPKANREVLQRALSRGNALMVTAVETDFAFAAASSVSVTCRAVLSAARAVALYGKVLHKYLHLSLVSPLTALGRCRRGDGHL